MPWLRGPRPTISMGAYPGTQGESLRINSDPEDVPLDVPTDILCSYHYYKDVDIAEVQGWGTRIIGDSGAFSAFSVGAPIDREDFHAWAARWQEHLFWIASLDVLGNVKESRANFLAAQRDGLNLVPTIHYLGGPEELDWYVEHGADLVGLGGTVGLNDIRRLRWYLTLFRYARDNHPGVRFHGWGASGPILLDNLPWWSTDSSGFAAAFMYGRLKLFDPRRGKFVAVDLNGHQIARHAKLLREHYHVDWRKILVSTPETRRPLARVAIKAVQLYGDWLRKRQQVSPPESLRAKLEQAETLGPIPTPSMGSPSMQPHKGISPEGTKI